MQRPNRSLLVAAIALCAVAVPGAVLLAVSTGTDNQVEVSKGGSAGDRCVATTQYATGDIGGVAFPDRAVLPDAGGAVVVTGVVRSLDCQPVVGAEVRFWVAAASGDYTEDSYGRVRSGDGGRFRFETFFPGSYPGAKPHVHVSAFIDGVEVRTELHPNSQTREYELDIVPPAGDDAGGSGTETPPGGVGGGMLP
jgi:protocatechuate 3,4-dioxygenase beta subunit